MDKNKGGNPSHDVRGSKPTYKELGIEYMQAHRWRVEASLPEEQFEAYIVDACENDKELTTADFP